MVPRGSVLTGEGRLRPAADLGSWARSRGYRSVSPELGDALAEGSAPDATTRGWTRCYERGNGAAVTCPDGYVEVNQATRPGAPSGDGRDLGRSYPASGARTAHGPVRFGVDVEVGTGIGGE